MELITSGISAKMNEQVEKKQFLKECGFLLIGVMVFPMLLNKLLERRRLKIVENKIYLDDELIIERREE